MTGAVRPGQAPILGLLAMCAAVPVSAQSAAAPATAPAGGAQHQGENGPDGTTPAPLTVALSYQADLNGLIAGPSPGVDYLGRLGVIIDADLTRLIGWSGATAHISLHQIHGRGLSSSRIGNLLPVSGLEAEPATRLFNLWIEQRLGRSVSLRLGQFTAGQEFAISKSAGLFVNSTFGWPGSFALDLPSGGPAYPLAAPGVRLAIAHGPSLLRIAAFAGDPAGRGDGDPQARDRSGLNGFRLARRQFLIAEVQRNWGSGDNPAITATFGLWLHRARFAAIAPVVGAMPDAPGSNYRGNFGFYAIGDARLWRSPALAQRELRGFVRASYSPADRNLIDAYVDTGLTLSAPFAGRPQDLLGLAVAVARVSPDLRRPGHNPGPSSEAVSELSYQYQLGGAAYLQPNIQYVRHPGGGVPSDDPTLAATRRALVVGLRFAIRR